MQISRHWRLNAQRYALQGETCPHCSDSIFPPREVCPRCGERTDRAPAVDNQRENQAVSMTARAALAPAAR